MKRIFLFSLLLFSQSFFGQSDYSKEKPIEPLYQKGGVENFYNYLTKTLDYNGYKNEKDIIIGFVLDGNGKMNHIKVGFCNNILFENQIKKVLENAEKWDVSNQTNKNYFICYKMKLFFENNQIKGFTKVLWHKEDVVDISMDVNEFNNYGVSNKNNLKTNLEDNNIYSSAGIEVIPYFIGGPGAFGEYIAKNYKLPNVKSLSGRVFVEFVVEKDGSLSDIKVIRDVGYGTGEEAVRVLKESPLWVPGSHNGKLIRVRYSLPIKIEIK